MEHLSSAELNDYARGLKREPNAHVAECVECGNLLSFLRKVWESAATIEVPAEVVEQAKRIFPGAWESIASRGLKQVLARLVYLQVGGQQLADVRSTAPAARQALYRYGDFCIDLRSQVETESVRTSLVGQIANQRDPLQAVGNIPVSLVSGKNILQQTASNELGEFVVDLVNSQRLRLRFDLATDGLSIEVPLRDLSFED